MNTVPQPLLDFIIRTRQHLHRNPELSFQEYATTNYLADILHAHNIRLLDTSMDTGIIAIIEGSSSGPHIALRADIDGLPINEDPSHDVISRTDGVMHACGHDLHMSSLLGASLMLSELSDTFSGSITLVFQPAEEQGAGENQVMQTHALDDVCAIIGYHNDPRYAPGTIAISDQPMMAAAGSFDITLTGESTHGAYPENGRSPIEAAATLVTALQTIVSRNISPLDATVVSITQVHAGNTYNVIPESATIAGTVRTLNQKTSQLVERRMRSLAESIATGFGLTSRLRWSFPGAPLVSDASLVDLAKRSVPHYANLINPTPSMGGEDFLLYLRNMPGLFAFIGSNGRPNAASWHSPQYLGFDDMLSTAVLYYVNTALDVLKH